MKKAETKKSGLKIRTQIKAGVILDRDTGRSR
jgi:hypothetical protein